MKLSELVFECVKDSIRLPNSNFGYSAFLNGDYNDKKDYSIQLASVFSALNLGFSRLYSYNKIPYFVMSVSPLINKLKFDKRLGEVICIAKPTYYGYEKLNFKILNMADKTQEILLLSPCTSEVYIEFKKAIPQFKIDDLVKIENQNGAIIDNNIDLLEEYNITNEMCNYLKEFVKADIMEVIAPDLANNHKIMAEQYFNGIEETYTSFTQQRVQI